LKQVVIKYQMRACSIICSIIFFAIITHAQTWDTIKLVNPSFEDLPQCCKPPKGWINCGFERETPPDVQPALDLQNNPFFNVTKKAFAGNTYLAMVVRENETYERVLQKLTIPLQAGKCYSFSIMLCRSDTYLSASNKNSPTDLKQFTSPVVLRIWGGGADCNQKQILAQSSLIENTYWERYDFQFEPESELSYFLLEAFYKTPSLFPYNGNVLLDDASDILEIDCSLFKK
jgi:hypothetical protein